MAFGRITGIAVVGLALALSACGRDGRPQRPPEPDVPPEGAQQEPQPEEQKDFLLDFLIQ